MRFLLIPFLALLGADTADPLDVLGALAGDLPAVVPPACPEIQTVQTPSGPSLDPSSPYGVHTLTLLSQPDDPGFLCSVSVQYASTAVWVSSSTDCADVLTVPARFPSGPPGTSSHLVVCVQATRHSTIPLVETVTLTTSNAPDVPVLYIVRGSS